MARELFGTKRPPAYFLRKMDAIAWLRKLGSESVDLIFTDPAYESLEKHRAVGTTTHLQDWFEIFPNERLRDLVREFYRVLKPNSHCYIMCDEETMHLLWNIVRADGQFTWWKGVVWDKTNSAGNGYHWRTKHEFIVFLEKGKRPLRDRTKVTSVQRCKRVYPKYPTKKPLDLIRRFIIQSSEPGEVVVDPFAGSGSTLVAAIEQGRDAWGCDTSDRSIAETTKWLVEKGAIELKSPSLLFMMD